MGDDVTQADRNGVRTPMQWNSQKNGGFSDADESSLYLPMIPDPVYHFSKINVENQVNDPESLFHWTKKLIAKKKTLKMLGRGDLQFLDSQNNAVLAFYRTYQEEQLLVLINVSDQAHEVKLKISAFKENHITDLFGGQGFDINNDMLEVSMKAWDYLWLK